MSKTSSSSSSAWWELTFEVPIGVGDDIAAILAAEGADGVQVIDATAIPPAPPDSGVWPDEVGERPEPPPMPSSETMAVIIASYTDADDGPELNAEALEVMPSELVDQVIDAAAQVGVALGAAGVKGRRRHDTGWTERWKQFFKPLKLGERFFVVPSWEQDFQAPVGACVIILDPGMAFGTGQHATTALCLEEIERFLAPMAPEERGRARILDVGCGSGILAIGAAKMGAASVLAIDNDPEAVRVAEENARENRVSRQVECSDAPLANVGGQFDLVVANILASVLIELAEQLIAPVAPGGRLVLSGILGEQQDDVVQAFQQAVAHCQLGAWRNVQTLRRAEWVCIVFDA